MMLHRIRDKLLGKARLLPHQSDAVWLYTQQLIRAWYTYEDQTVRPVLHTAVTLSPALAAVVLDSSPSDSLPSFHTDPAKIIYHDITVDPATPLNSLVFLLESMTARHSPPLLPGLVLADSCDDIRYLEEALEPLGVSVRGIEHLKRGFEPLCLREMVDGANSTLAQYGRLAESGLHAVDPAVAPIFFEACARLLEADPWNVLRCGDALSLSVSDGNERVFSLCDHGVESVESWDATGPAWQLSFGATTSTLDFDDDDAWRGVCPGCKSFPHLSPSRAEVMAWFTVAAHAMAYFTEHVHGKLSATETWSDTIDGVPRNALAALGGTAVVMEWHGLSREPDATAASTGVESGSGMSSVLAALMRVHDEMVEEEEEEEEEGFVTASEGSETEDVPLCAQCGEPSAFMCSLCHSVRYAVPFRHSQRQVLLQGVPAAWVRLCRGVR